MLFQNQSAKIDFHRLLTADKKAGSAFCETCFFYYIFFTGTSPRLREICPVRAISMIS